MSQEIVTAEGFTTEDLRGIDSFESALSLVTGTLGAPVLASEELGDGFALLTDKDRLIGQAMIILQFAFHESDKGTNGEFVSMHVVTRGGEKFIVNDGGSGIYAQLRDYVNTHPGAPLGGILVAKGLRRSDYIHPEHGASTTHYLDTSA